MCAQVLLLIDKQAYDTQNEVVVYVPTSHVLLHDADMLGLQVTTIHVTRDMIRNTRGLLQLLTYYTTEDEEEEASHRYAEESCWHARPGR